LVPANDAPTSIAAICSRILKKQPGRDDEYFSLFRKWCFQHLDELGLTKQSVVAVSFNEWNQNYPLAQQRAHIKAMEQLKAGNFRQWLVDERNEFTKIEMLMKGSPQGDPDFTARAIQGGTPHHNIATGPFCRAFSKKLAALWSVTNSKGPMYTSGATSEDIGTMFQNAVAALADNVGIIEGDFVRFDSTIHRDFLTLEADIYKHLGCSEQAYLAFMSCIQTVGRDKFGNRYSVDGGRHSGDHNTSCGNTLLQALAILFCLSFFDAQTTGVILSPKEIVVKYTIALPCLGDDNLIIGDAVFVKAVSDSLVGLLGKLGLELKPKMHFGPHAKYHASFCSSRFYPVEGGKVVLGPGVGRGIVKSGWYVNPPVGVDLKRLLRADSIGRSNDCSFIPFLSSMWNKNLDLTKGVTKLVTTREMRRNQLYNAHVRERHYACEETYTMLNVVYGLTLAHEKEYIKMLTSVTSLPCIVDYEPLALAARIDGVADDDYEFLVEDENTPIETVGTFDEAAYRVTMAAFSIEDEKKEENEKCSFCRMPIPCKCRADMAGDEVEACVEDMPLLMPFDQ
jgi:hypothetical protein